MKNFSMLLTIISFMGIQVAQAGEVHCPASNAIESDPGEQRHTWHYKGTTTGAKAFEMDHIGRGGLKFEEPIRAMKSYGTLYCEYGLKPIGNPSLKYKLTSDTKDCHTVDAQNNLVGNGDYGTHFECP